MEDEEKLVKQLELFLAKFVEGYLYHDLINMAQIWPKINEDHGAVGYPMIMTTLSGMELLGDILNPNGYKPSPEVGYKNFCFYWDKYMALTNKVYEGRARLFRDLLRNGLAHTYLTASGIGVTKGSSKSHMIATADGLIVDCLSLFSDFWKSYIEIARPKIDKDKVTRLVSAKNVSLILQSVIHKSTNHNFLQQNQKNKPTSIVNTVRSSSTSNSSPSTFVTPSGIGPSGYNPPIKSTKT